MKILSLKNLYRVAFTVFSGLLGGVNALGAMDPIEYSDMTKELARLQSSNPGLREDQYPRDDMVRALYLRRKMAAMNQGPQVVTYGEQKKDGSQPNTISSSTTFSGPVVVVVPDENVRAAAEADARRKTEAANRVFAIENEAARPAREAAFADVKAGKISRSEAMKRMGAIPPERAAIVAQYKEGRISYDDAMSTLRGVPVKKQSVSTAPAKGTVTPSSAVSSSPAKKG